MALPLLEPRLIFTEGPGERAAVVPGSPVRLLAGRCAACGRVEFPRPTTCPSCAGDIEKVPLSDRPTLAGFTSVLHPPPGALVATPYHVGVAAFPEGISVLGLLVGVPDGGAGSLRIGAGLATVAAAVGEHATYAYRVTSADPAIPTATTGHRR